MRGIQVVKKYYSVGAPARSEFQFLESPKGTPFNLLEDKKVIPNWSPLTLKMDCSKFPDHTSCLFSKHVFSKRIKSILDSYHFDNSIQWLPVYLKNSMDEIQGYFIPHLIIDEDLLDPQETEYSNSGCIYRAAYPYNKIKDKNFFFNAFRRLTISEKIKKEIQKIGGTNFVFTKERSILYPEKKVPKAV